MSVGLSIDWENGETEFGCPVAQDSAKVVAAWARERGLPLLSEMDSNVFPQFTPETLEPLILEFEQLHEWCAEFRPDANLADRFLPRLRALRNERGWTFGCFG